VSLDEAGLVIFWVTSQQTTTSGGSSSGSSGGGGGGDNTVRSNLCNYLLLWQSSFDAVVTLVGYVVLSFNPLNHSYFIQPFLPVYILLILCILTLLCTVYSMYV